VELLENVGDPKKIMLQVCGLPDERMKALNLKI
jgi:hypothetical protein